MLVRPLTVPYVALCRRLNVRRGKKDGLWKVTTYEPEHNHLGHSKQGIELLQGREGVSEDVMRTMRNCATSNMQPFMAIRFLREHHPDLPTCVDERMYQNILTEGQPAASDDADALLKRLLKAKELDDNWVVEYMVDSVGRLAHLFWMTPEQV